MTYETMDWEAEAKRVAKAFNVLSACYFDYDPDEAKCDLCSRPAQTTASVFLTDWHQLRSSYDRDEGRLFEIHKGTSNVFILIYWDGDVNQSWGKNSDLTPGYFELINMLAKGLFHMDLLTIEVEAHLQTSITVHQKLEWTLEYEERCK